MQDASLNRLETVDQVGDRAIADDVRGIANEVVVDHGSGVGRSIDGYESRFHNIDQIRNFLDHIDRLTKRAFLSRQWLKWRNPDDQQLVDKKDFALGDRWQVELDQIDDIHRDFFIQIWLRENNGSDSR